MSRSVAIAAVVSLAFIAGAVGSFVKAHALRKDGDWLMARGAAEAQEYANSFETRHADAQLLTFDERRAVLESANRWQGLQLFCILGAVLSAFGAYVLYLYWRLRQQLVDATDGLDAREHEQHHASGGRGVATVA